MIKKQYWENIFFIIVSFVLSPFFYGLFLIHKFKPINQLKILVIQTAKIGDLICSTPVFREIKRHYPQSFLSVLIIPKTEGVIINNPYIDEIILFDKKKYSNIRNVLDLIKGIRKKNFDWSFSLLPGILENVIPFWSGIPNRVGTTSLYSSRGTKILSIFNNYRLEYRRHTLALKHYLSLLKFIDISQVDERKEIFVEPIEEKKALRFLKENKLNTADFLVGISLTAGNKFKEWSLKKFVKLADKLIEELGAKIIFVGAPQDNLIIKQAQREMKNKSSETSQSFNLSEAPALFQYFKIFISVDSGSLYIANAMGVPVVDIAGPIDIYEQPPLGDKCRIVQKELDCLPCSFILPPARNCKEGHCRCIRGISIDDVFRETEKLYNTISCI